MVDRFIHFCTRRCSETRIVTFVAKRKFYMPHDCSAHCTERFNAHDFVQNTAVFSNAKLMADVKTELGRCADGITVDARHSRLPIVQSSEHRCGF